MTDDQKREIKFQTAMYGDFLRDAFRVTKDSRFAYLLGRLDQAIATAEPRELAA